MCTFGLVDYKWPTHPLSNSKYPGTLRHKLLFLTPHPPFFLVFCLISVPEGPFHRKIYIPEKKRVVKSLRILGTEPLTERAKENLWGDLVYPHFYASPTIQIYTYKKIPINFFGRINMNIRGKFIIFKILYAQNRNSCHDMLKLANHRFLDSAWDVIGILRCSTTERSGLPHLEWTYQNL